MAGIALIFNRRPWEGTVDTSPMRTMMHRMRHRGPDGSRVVAENGFVLGCHRFNVCPEGVRDPQPLRDAWGATYVAFDGHIDNRDALGRRLGLRGPQRSQLSDAALVLAAWESFDVDCFQYISGSFAVVILDMRRNRAVMARDPLGGRPLNYRIDKECLLAASEERALLAHPRVSHSINETRVAQHLAGECPDDGSTFFGDILQVRPGEMLCVEGTRVTMRRFFDARNITPVRYATQDEYAEHFRELLVDAVSSCARSIEPPAIMIDGDFASASIGALVARVRTDAVFWTNTDTASGPDGEGDVVGALMRETGASLEQIDPGALYMPDPLVPGSNDNAPATSAQEMLRSMQLSCPARAGHRLVLTSSGSENLFDIGGAWLSDSFGVGDHALALRCLKGAMRSSKLRRPAFDALRCSLFAGAGSGKRVARAKTETRPKWMDDIGWRLVCDARERRLTRSRPDQRDEQLRRMFGGVAQRAVGQLSAGDVRLGLERRSPFRTQEVVSFALAVPAHVLSMPGDPERLLRIAMKDYLPMSASAVSPRGVKATRSPGHFVVSAARVMAVVERANRWPRLHLAQSGLLEVIGENDVVNVQSAALWRALGLLLWRDGLERQRSALRLSA